MLSREVCRMCRRKSKIARLCGYDVNRELTIVWACPALIALDRRDSDAHTVGLDDRPPKGCLRMLEQAVSETMEGGTDNAL